MSILAVILAAIIAAVDGDAPISVSKSIYRIHGLTAFPAAKYMEWFSQTFDEYLNAEVAPLFTNNGQQIRSFPSPLSLPTSPLLSPPSRFSPSERGAPNAPAGSHGAPPLPISVWRPHLTSHRHAAFDAGS